MPTTAKEKSAAEQHVESLRAKYDKLAAEVGKTAINTPERHEVMEAKKAAFTEWHNANSAMEKAQVAADEADQKKSAAEAAAVEADAAKKHAADVARHPDRVNPPAVATPRPVGR